MEMQSFHTFGQLITQQISHHTKSRTGCTRIVQIGFHIGVFRINPQSAGDIFELSLRVKPFKLLQRIKCYMAAATHNFRKFAVGVSRSVGMRFAAHFLISQTGFSQRTGRGIRNIFAHNGKNAPHGKCFESEDNFYSGTFFYRFYKFQIFTESCFVENIAGRRNF